MASLNKGSFQKDILDDGINILAVNVEQNGVHPYMSELTNATMIDPTQTSTKIPQMIYDSTFIRNMQFSTFTFVFFYNVMIYMLLSRLVLAIPALMRAILSKSQQIKSSCDLRSWLEKCGFQVF